ncbi:MAG: hypothetical protein PF961_15645 [Planctomycetota bacterium]|jgi:hypothetical protein|nr:hypothetical protein [Planctomycetota bacterium]
MRKLLILCVVCLFIPGIIAAAEIDRPALIDAFISYTAKSSGEKLSPEIEVKMREQLGQLADNPLLMPYAFEGEAVDREACYAEIASCLVKVASSDMPMPSSLQYASKRARLESLSDAELVIAMRFAIQLAEQVRS